MYKLFKDELEEIENFTLKNLKKIELLDVYGIRISDNADSDLPYLFKYGNFPLKEENLSSYRWFKHKTSGSEYKTLMTNSSGLFEKIEYDKAIEFIKRYRGLYILESAQYEKLTKNEYSAYKEGSIKTDITNIDNDGELSAYISIKYHNLYIMYLIEQKIDHDSIVQINADEAASWLSLKLPLETIYAYDGTDVTIIYVSNGYIRQSRPGYIDKNDGYKMEELAKIGYNQIKSILDDKYKNCKFFKYTDMPRVEINHVNGDQYIEIDSKYAVDFIKSGKHILDLNNHNTISGTYFLSRDKKEILYDDVFVGQCKCNNADLPKHLFVDRKDYYDYISLVIKKISGDDVEEEKVAHINCSDYKVIISAIDKLDIETKKKLYNSICEMAHKFDGFYDFYIAQYRSDKNKLKFTRFDDLPLFMFAGFYKIYIDNNVNNRKYFTMMVGCLYAAMIIDSDTDINAFIISFMENKDNDKKCYLDENNYHDWEIYYKQLEFTYVNFANFLKNELFVELKKVDPNISNIEEAVSLVQDSEYVMRKIDKLISDIDGDCDIKLPPIPTPSSNVEKTIQTEQDNKIQLSEEEINNIYHNIIGSCYILTPRDLSAKRNKIKEVSNNLKNTKLKEKLEFILNSNMDILRSFKYSEDNIVKEVSEALYVIVGVSDIYIKHIIIWIIRNLYNKYIYDNKLPFIMDICKKYQNKIEDETISDAIFTYLFNLNPVIFFGKIIEDYYNRDDDELDTIEYYSDFMNDCFGIPKWDEN